MKKLLMIVAAMALGGAAMAMSLQEAQAQIPGVVANSVKMADIMKQLTEDDQIEFLAMVNKAIAELNGSANEIAALYVSVNEEALKAHGKDNLKALLATTFATVPPEYLTVVNERFAADLFNRNADPTNPVSDENFAKLARETMSTIATRTSDTDEAAVRNTFAILMFERAAGEPLGRQLRQELVNTIDDPAARELALNEWIPSALGESGRNATYDPLLGASDVDTTVPDPGVLLVIAPSQDIVPLLADMAAKDDDPYMHSISFSMDNMGLPEDTQDSLFYTTRPSGLRGTPWMESRGDKPDYYEYGGREPRTYPYQSF